MLNHAEKSIRIYDDHGESTMLEYIALTSAQPQHPLLWDSAGTCVLDDGSIVQRHEHEDQPHHIAGYHYHFLWADHRPAHQYVRLSNKDHVTMPYQNERPLVTWPTANTIVIKVAERADQAAAERANLPYYPQNFEDDNLILSVIHNIAPSARAAVNTVMDTVELPDATLAELDLIQYEISDDAILKMADGEFDALSVYIEQMTKE